MRSDIVNFADIVDWSCVDVSSEGDGDGDGESDDGSGNRSGRGRGSGRGSGSVVYPGRVSRRRAITEDKKNIATREFSGEPTGQKLFWTRPENGGENLVLSWECWTCL